MTNEELIKALRHCGRDDVISESCLPCNYYGRKPYCEGVLLNAAADALEAAEHRIADLETALAACRVQRGEKYE